MTEKKVALVAGGSSGLGKAVAECLAQKGFVTYAGARSFAKGTAAPAGCKAAVLDVSDEVSVANAVDGIIAAEGRIDVLVCCAASFTMSPMEELPIDTLRDMMNVNFLGMARCVQKVMPLFRAQGGGHVILFSSLNGLFSIPFQGAYSATKHAVEAYGEALSQEARRFGVKVTVVEPGDCRGGSQKYRLTHLNAGSPYKAAFENGTSKIHHDESHGLTPETVGFAVARAAMKKHPPMRMKVASIDQRAAAWLHRFLPGNLFNRIMTLYYHA